MNQGVYYIQKVFQDAEDEWLSKHEISERLWEDYGHWLSPLRVKCYLWSVFTGRLDSIKEEGEMFYNLEDPFEKFFVDDVAYHIHKRLLFMKMIGSSETVSEISEALKFWDIYESKKSVANYVFGPFRDEINYDKDTQKVTLIRPFIFDSTLEYVPDDLVKDEPVEKKGNHQILVQLEMIIEEMPDGDTFFIHDILQDLNNRVGGDFMLWELEKLMDQFIGVVKKHPYGNSKYFKILPQMNEVKEEIQSKAI